MTAERKPLALAEAAPPLRGSAALKALGDYLHCHPRLFVLTGAGCSTDSGIPDYRDGEGNWKGSRPMQWRMFAESEDARGRYWARSLVGWSRVGTAAPNAAHRVLATFEIEGRIAGIVTQNVDGLHQRAGSRRVIDLHGRLDRVECMDCGGVMPRAAYQVCLLERNPAWAKADAAIAPDGDADLGITDHSAFRVPPCHGCGGVMRPSVVFFGESVPAPRVETAMQRLRGADGLLVVGSSLMVWSGLRFVRAAAAAGLPCAALNLGRTRADPLLQFRAALPCGIALENVGKRVSAS